MSRALVISRHPWPMQTTLRRNVSELLRQGVQVDLVCLTGRLTWGTPAAQGVRLFGIPFRQRRTHAIWYPVHYASFFVWALVAASMLALRRRYDAVEVDNTPDFLVFTAVVARLRHMRIVLFSMELMPELTAARLRVGPRALPVRIATRLERAAIAWADHVITVSEPCRRILLGRGLADRKLSVVPNSHRTADLEPSCPSAPPFLVIQTTLIERYGVRVAIEAMAELAHEFPELTLEILGEGEGEAALIELTTRLGIGDRVHFSHGYLPWTQMIDRVRQATLGIVPLLADGYGDLCVPNKVLELAAIGVPAVCSRLPAIEEHFPPDALAYFEPGDVGGLAAQVRRLLADPAAAGRQAARARDSMDALSWDTAAGRYLAALGLDRATPALTQRTDHARAS
jgi:glycosyltransferase involved in cell wall biosynthesis